MTHSNFYNVEACNVKWLQYFSYDFFCFFVKLIVLDVIECFIRYYKEKRS